MGTILIVDDMRTIREQYTYDIKRKTDFEVLSAANGRDALAMLAEEAQIDVVILDLEMPVMSGLDMLEVLSREGPRDVPVIVYTAAGNFSKCVRAIQLGAYNFFDKDEVNIDALIRNIENAISHRNLLMENQALRRAAGSGSALIGNSRNFRELRQHIEKVAAVPSNVLISGESGTGKELVAREIHRLSSRAKGPFVAVNCAAIPENLVESELFGFEKGAFTGANRTTRGKFEIARGGTLFLDEIGDMPLAIQAKLLRVLQESEITRLGGEGRVIKIDVRVIAATHRDLERESAAGRFRQDLYYRICTHIIAVPPLRERIEDVEPLAAYFVAETCKRFGMPPKQLPPDTINALKMYDWRKNNVRELENIVERMIIQSDGPAVLPEHIPADILPREAAPDLEEGKSFQELKQQAEKQILIRYLEAHDWHITNTARALGIANHSNLLKMMRRLEIKRPEE
ncbi:MAG: sigma-54-dependent Fis family transcriptional regulator [Calditrichaeota bacterium]|nr:sigma-54-dependent Fis family transcriptional regulator [Calditrichota bacterium]